MATPHTPHPPPETIAAIAEGKLTRRTLAPMLAHIEECAECRTELALVSGSSLEDVPPSPVRNAGSEPSRRGRRRVKPDHLGS